MLQWDDLTANELLLTTMWMENEVCTSARDELLQLIVLEECYIMDPNDASLGSYTYTCLGNGQLRRDYYFDGNHQSFF